MMAKRLRKKLFVDKKVQGALLRRLVGYWGLCLLFVTVPLLIAQTFVEPTRFFFQQFDVLWGRYWPVVGLSFLLMPFVLYDAIKFSNRFAGPLLRLRREMRNLANGEQVQPLRFRDDDFWQDLAVRFNQVAARVQSAEQTAGLTAGVDDECFSVSDGFSLSDEEHMAAV
jgi:hypothetical protein